MFEDVHHPRIHPPRARRCPPAGTVVRRTRTGVLPIGGQIRPTRAADSRMRRSRVREAQRPTPLATLVTGVMLGTLLASVWVALIFFIAS